ncbi:uncharacterized protein LOC129586372 [Paramacrobiotus metropolitanus]|uniref:uncharacterized protein LOC129586372 n=1 Tax=Paramacrobiotus metropolitanus TaxID=2943436 RepID=UPI002446341F|nr:uncharacterized protein LOC129586372 [Paramacrobiotus metropolitanus]
MSQLECELQGCMRKARQYEMENPNALRQLTQRKVAHILIRCARRHTKGQTCNQCEYGAPGNQTQAAHRKSGACRTSPPTPADNPRSPVTSVCRCSPGSCDATPDRCTRTSTSGRTRSPSRCSGSCSDDKRSPSPDRRSVQTVVSTRSSNNQSQNKTRKKSQCTESNSFDRPARSISLTCEQAIRKRRPSRTRATTSRKRKVT